MGAVLSMVPHPMTTLQALQHWMILSAASLPGLVWLVHCLAVLRLEHSLLLLLMQLAVVASALQILQASQHL